MKIAIDCRSLRKKPVGVPNFLIAVINSLAEEQKNWIFYLLSNEDFSQEVKKKLISSPNIITIIKPIRFLPKVATIWYLFKTYSILKKLRIDLFYTPIPNLPLLIPARVKTMITVHDMVYKRFPATMSTGNRVINFFLHDRSIRKADRIWTVSEYTKGEVEAFFPDRKCRRIEVGTAVDKNIYHPPVISIEEQDELLSKYQIKRPFLISVGTLEPRKNLHFLLSLMPLLASKNLQLIIVGAHGWGHSRLNTTEKMKNYDAEKVKFAGFIPDEDLVKLYSQASLYISTSLNEGFCLPLLEAMCCGCPVVAAHNSGMIEVVNGGGETVGTWNKDNWVQTIEKIMDQRPHYVKKGFVKAAYYDWREVVSRIINFMQEQA